MEFENENASVTGSDSPLLKSEGEEDGATELVIVDHSKWLLPVNFQ